MLTGDTLCVRVSVCVYLFVFSNDGAVLLDLRLRFIQFSPTHLLQLKTQMQTQVKHSASFSHQSFHNNTIFNPSVPSGRHISCLSKDNCVHRLYKCKTCLRGTIAIYSSTHPEYCESSLIPLHSKYRHIYTVYECYLGNTKPNKRHKEFMFLMTM